MTGRLTPVPPVWMDDADRTAAAYGRRRPRYPVLPATVGLALALMVNRNTTADRRLWRPSPVVDTVMLAAAEAFAAGVGHPVDPAWRPGALSSLRTLAGSAVHEDEAGWPAGVRGDPDARPLVRRLWLACGDEGPGWSRWTTLPGWLLERGRIPGADTAAGWDAMMIAFREGYPQVCAYSMSSAGERPADTVRLGCLVTRREVPRWSSWRGSGGPPYWQMTP